MTIHFKYSRIIPTIRPKRELQHEKLDMNNLFPKDSLKLLPKFSIQTLTCFFVYVKLRNYFPKEFQSRTWSTIFFKFQSKKNKENFSLKIFESILKTYDTI